MSKGAITFPLGRIVITRNAMDSLCPGDVPVALSRHSSGDWGDLEHSDWAANNRALENSERLLSVYHDRNGTKFWIITEWDRSWRNVKLHISNLMLSLQ